MRAYIDRFVAGLSRDLRRTAPRGSDVRSVRLVPGSGRPRRARATFIAVENRTALAH